jgi:hypothetical protein
LAFPPRAPYISRQETTPTRLLRTDRTSLPASRTPDGVAEVGLKQWKIKSEEPNVMAHLRTQDFLFFRGLAVAGFAVIALFLSGVAVAGLQYIEDGYALSGYDAVAYFEEERPVMGDPAFAHEWNGAAWLFVSDQNRERFAANPEAFAPQYDGHCAYGAAKGYVVPGDPRYWRIVDGKLYVNLNEDVQERWVKDIPGYIAQADARWPELNP